MNPPDMPRLLVIHAPGLDWRIIHALSEDGDLPTLSGLIERGTIGNLFSQRPLSAPAPALSLATGRTSLAHGGLRAVRPAPDTPFGVRPTDRRDLKASPFWEIAATAGVDAAAVGWPASHPASGAAALTVSDWFARAEGAGFDDWTLDPAAISDPEARTALEDLRLHPTEVSADMVAPFAPDMGRVDQGVDGRIAVIAVELARASSIHGAATWIAEHRRPRLLAVHFDFIDRMSAAFMRYRAPRLGYVSARDFEIYAGVVDQAYRFFDLLVARYLELFGEGLQVVICAAHGYQTGPLRARPKDGGRLEAQYRRFGVLLAAGPSIKQDATIFGAAVCDIAPTALALLGAPSDPSLDGRLLGDLFHAPPVLQAGETAPPAGRPEGEAEKAAWRRWAVHLKELAAFGHLPAVPTDPEAAARWAEIDWLRASIQAAMDDKNFDLALELVERILATAPDDRASMFTKARAHYLRHEPDACLAALGELTAAGVDDPEVDCLAGLAALKQSDVEGGLARLRLVLDADLHGAGGLRLLERTGDALARAQCLEEAETAYLQALAIDERSATALRGLGAVLTATGRHAEAVVYLGRSVAERYMQPDTHCNLGRSWLALGRREDALKAFQTALDQRPDLEQAAEGARQVMAAIAADAAAAGARRQTP